MLISLFSISWYTAILLAILGTLLYFHLTRYHGYWESRGVPCQKPLFLVGNLWEVFSGKRPIGKHLGHLYKQYDTPYFGIYIIGQPYLVIRDPEIIKNITVRDFHNFDDRTFARDEKVDPMAGNSLFIIRNPDWKNIRAKLTPIFTSGKLKLMFPLMKEIGGRLEEFLDTKHGEVLDIKDVAANFMTDLVGSCFFGISINSFGENSSEFRIITRKMFDVDIATSFRLFSYFFAPSLVSLFKLQFFDTTFLKNAFLQTLDQREKGKVHRNDFVDLLLSVRDKFEGSDCIFDTNQMVSQAITFFIAGFETTSNALAFTLYELCLAQDCQDKVREEIFEMFEENEEISFDKVQQMKYLDMVLCETLRRYPFGPFLNRKCKNDYVIPQTGLTIEKGTPILVPIDGIHFDPNYYPEPEKFIPERFSDGNKQYSNAFTYMPFGVGPRNCIGDRFGQIAAKVGLVYLLRKFKVTPCKETPVPLVLNPKSPFMTPIDGLKMVVSPV